MSTHAEAQEASPVRIQVSLDGRRLAIALILALQAGWLGTIMLRGWYSGPDLANLGAATGQPLDSHYLALSLGGHFGAPARLLYWVLNRVSPLGWGLTVALRLVLQAAATFLLLKLLEELVGRRTWLLGIVALYAFSPLLVPATAVLSNGIGLSVAQTAVVGALLLHVRYSRGGRLWQALLSAVLVLLALSFADEAAVLLLLIPTLSLGFLLEGTVRQRLRTLVATWPAWVALAGAVGVFGVLYLNGTYSGRPAGFSTGDAWDIARTEWTQVLGPSLLGGPWDWGSLPDQWVAYATPPRALRVLGQLTLVVLVVVSVRRTGKRALLAWAIPVVTTLLGVLLVGYGRSEFLGTLVAPILRYSYYTALTLAIGVTLAFARTGSAQQRTSRRWARRSTVGAMALVGAASIVSGLGFADTFWDNPSKQYVDTLLAAVHKAGPSVELYDTTLPEGVVPAIEPNHFISDVLALAGARARFGRDAAEPLIVNDRGVPVPANFLHVTDVSGPTQKPCGTFVHGAGSQVVQLGIPATEGIWYLQLQLYEPHANTVTLTVRDVAGHVLALTSGSATIRPTSTLVAVNRRLAAGTPATLTFTSTDTTTNLCLVHAYLGAPFPKGAS